MSSTIIIKNSATSGSVPPSLVQGEFGINVYDGKLYYGSGSGNVVKEFNSSSYASFAVSASYAATSSYANNFNVAGTLTALSASITYLVNVFETSSTIYSSGSNQFGDDASDLQTLYGTVDIKTGPVLISGSLITTGSNTLIGNTFLTGSLNVTGSTTQVGNNTLLGNTSLSGSIIISGSLGTNNPTVKIYGDTTHDGYIRFDPVSTNIDNTISASYIYVSGSTNDLYFSQNGNGYNNTTRLRWLEGNLYTGLLNGGVITTQSATVYQISSGSGIIVDLNASLSDNPYPTIQYLNWGNLSASIAAFTASYQQAFVGIDSTNNIFAQGEPFTNGQFDSIINIGNVLFQNGSTINGVKTQPSVAYGFEQQQNIFNRAFGPLKLSGYTLAPSASSTGSLIVGSGTAYAPGSNYINDPNESFYTVDSGTNISKIFRYYQSGSTWVYLTNAGAGYPTIDPTQYSNNGTLTGVGAGNWSIQRCFWYPNSVTKAIVVYYGNAIYPTEAEALANISFESFTEAPNTAANAIYLGAIIINQNGVFTNTNTFTIYPSGLFRQVGGSGGGGSIITTTLSGLSDVNISGPTDGQALVYNATALKWENESYFSGSISGNAATATSASYATTASYVLNAVSASFATTASFSTTSLTASLALRASGSLTGSLLGTASYASQALSSSFATTASYVANASSFPFTGSAIITGSLSVIGPSTVTGSFTVITGSSIELQVTNTGVKIGNASTDTHTVTGSLQVAGQTRISGSFNTAISGTILTVVGSGSTQPIFTVQGSQGELFSVTDSLSGSLFSVNDISGLPILEVFSNSTTNMGNYLAPALYTTNKITQTNSGSFVVYSLPTASYDGAFYDYTVRSGSNARAGQIMAIWSGSSVNFTETTTTSFGDTSAINFIVIVTGSNMALTGSSATGSWTIKTIIRSI